MEKEVHLITTALHALHYIAQQNRDSLILSGSAMLELLQSPGAKVYRWMELR
jgi:hypothetical protein